MQSAEWGMQAGECHIIGNYAQTELGHGTYLRYHIHTMPCNSDLMPL